MRHYRCKYEFLELYRGKGVTVILIITARVVVMDSIDDGARECSFVWFFSDVIAFSFLCNIRFLRYKDSTRFCKSGKVSPCAPKAAYDLCMPCDDKKQFLHGTILGKRLRGW